MNAVLPATILRTTTNAQRIGRSAADFFREIYDTARSVKPDALVEFCPCGTAYSFFTMPHFNMSVHPIRKVRFRFDPKARH